MPRMSRTKAHAQSSWGRPASRAMKRLPLKGLLLALGSALATRLFLFGLTSGARCGVRHDQSGHECARLSDTGCPSAGAGQGTARAPGGSPVWRAGHNIGGNMGAYADDTESPAALLGKSK